MQVDTSSTYFKRIYGLKVNYYYNYLKAFRLIASTYIRSNRPFNLFPSGYMLLIQHINMLVCPRPSFSTPNCEIPYRKRPKAAMAKAPAACREEAPAVTIGGWPVMVLLLLVGLPPELR